MVFDGALADAQIGGDIFTGMTRQNQFHDLSLSWSETGDSTCRALPGGEQLAGIPRLFESIIDAAEQFAVADRLFDEVPRAGLHGLNGHRHIAIARDHD